MRTADPTIWFQIRNNYAEEWWNARQGAKPLKFRTEASARIYIENQRALMALGQRARFTVKDPTR